METVSDALELAALPDAGLDLRGAARPSRLADFYELTKPRMNFLVLVTTAVGAYLATRPGWDEWARLAHALLGTAMAAAGASVLNQYVERDYDQLMSRTRGRPLPAGRVSPVEALLVGVLLAAGGIVYLAALVNLLTAALGALTVATYVFVYTPMKRWTTLCTVVGAVPGAIPPMMGWTAVTGTLSAEAWALFGILFFWQMPHFLAIALLYRDDYARGGFKMLPVVDGDGFATARQIVLYGLALVPVTLLPGALRMAGPVYLIAALLFGVTFLGFGVNCALRMRRGDARWLFLSSILYLPALLAVMMLDKLARSA